MSSGGAGGARRQSTAASVGDSSDAAPYWPRASSPRAHSVSSRDRVALSHQHYQQPSHHLHLQHPQPQSITQAAQLEQTQRVSSYYSSTPRTDSSRSISNPFSTSAPPSLEAPIAAVAPPISSFWADSPTGVGPSTYAQPTSDLPHHRNFDGGSRLSTHYQQYHPYAQSHHYQHHSQQHTTSPEVPADMGQHARSNRLSIASTSSSGLSYYSPVAASTSGMLLTSEGHETSTPVYHIPPVSEPPLSQPGYMQPSHPSVSASAPYANYPTLEGYSSTMPPHLPSHYSTHNMSVSSAGSAMTSTGGYGDSRVSYLVPIEVKHRRRTTKAQFKVLEGTFKEVTKPNAALRKSLSIQLDMPPRAIQIWFQNRRAKAKSAGATREGASMDTGSDTAERSTKDASRKGKSAYSSSYEVDLHRRNTSTSSYSEPGPSGTRPAHSDERASETSSSDQSHASMGLPNTVSPRVAGPEDRFAAPQIKNSYSSHGSSSSSVGGDRMAYRMTPTSSLGSLGSMSMYTAPSSASASSSSASRDRAGSHSSSGYGYSSYSHMHSLSSLAAGDTSPPLKSKSEHRRAQSISHQASSATLSASKRQIETADDASLALPGVAIGRRLSWSPSPVVAPDLPLQEAPLPEALLPRGSAPETADITAAVTWPWMSK